MLVPHDLVDSVDAKYDAVLDWAFSTHVIASTHEVANSEELVKTLGKGVLVFVLTDKLDRRLLGRAQERN